MSRIDACRRDVEAAERRLAVAKAMLCAALAEAEAEPVAFGCPCLTCVARYEAERRAAAPQTAEDVLFKALSRRVCAIPACGCTGEEHA